MNYESNAPRIIEICISTTAIATFFVCLRLYTRAIVLHSFGKEDWFILFAGITALGSSIVSAFRTKFGLGRHVWTVPPADVEPGLKLLYTAILLYNASQILVKISLLLQYLRIFETPQMKRVCYIALGIISVYGLWAIASSIFTCIPIQAYWDTSIHGRCFQSLTFWYTTSSLNIVTDVAIFVLPLPILLKLQLPLRQRLILIFIFTIGFFVCIVSILRLHTLKVAVETSDPTWDDEAAATWSALELNMGIVCSCLPTLRPLVTRILPRFLTVNTATPTNSTDIAVGSKVHLNTSRDKFMSEDSER
ncbi:hypothetical protein N431DRAFT_475032 [Stipitochalara longipes BDJ]|nr:hypothetical protein N431DRAFT_475032 [Stipitochalara longipes BDJ]